MNDERIKFVTEGCETRFGKGSSQDSLGSGTFLFTLDDALLFPAIQ